MQNPSTEPQNNQAQAIPTAKTDAKSGLSFEDPFVSRGATIPKKQDDEVLPNAGVVESSSALNESSNLNESTGKNKERRAKRSNE